jgi:hypothetical protein
MIPLGRVGERGWRQRKWVARETGKGQHRCFSQTLGDIQKELGSRKYRQKVEETGGVLFIDQYRMKIMPQVKYNYRRKEI